MLRVCTLFGFEPLFQAESAILLNQRSFQKSRGRSGKDEEDEEDAWRTQLNQTFTISSNTTGTVLVTIPFTNMSCTGNSASCSPSKMSVGGAQYRPLRHSGIKATVSLH